MKKGDRVVVKERFCYSGMTGVVLEVGEFDTLVLFDEKNEGFHSGGTFNPNYEKRCYWFNTYELKKIYDDFIKNIGGV